MFLSFAWVGELVLLLLLLAFPLFAAEPAADEWRLLLIQEQMSRARSDINTSQLLREHAQLRLQILEAQEAELKKKIEAEKGK